MRGDEVLHSDEFGRRLASVVDHQLGLQLAKHDAEIGDQVQRVQTWLSSALDGSGPAELLPPVVS